MKRIVYQPVGIFTVVFLVEGWRWQLLFIFYPCEVHECYHFL